MQKPKIRIQSLQKYFQRFKYVYKNSNTNFYYIKYLVYVIFSFSTQKD